jgi:hypothetical protein
VSEGLSQLSQTSFNEILSLNNFHKSANWRYSKSHQFILCIKIAIKFESWDFSVW